VEEVEGFWVGKESYKQWNKLAKKATENKLEREIGPVKMVLSATSNNESETDDSEDKQKNGQVRNQSLFFPLVLKDLIIGTLKLAFNNTSL
jgi:hypothetical protein